MKNRSALTEIQPEIRDAENALQKFVSASQAIQPYPDITWQSVLWDVTSSNTTTRAHLGSRKTLIFAEHTEKKVATDRRIAFINGFDDLVKACIVLRRVNRGLQDSVQDVFVRAARYLYAALPLPVRHDPTFITLGHFLLAENSMLEREMPASAYRVAVQLDELGRTLDRHGLCRLPVNYRSKIRRPANHIDRTSSTFEQRAKDLPTSEVLNALATISNDSSILERPFDLLRVRITELLLVGGFRVGEVLTLPVNTLVRESVRDEAGVVRGDAVSGEPIERLGLRYWPEKGGEPIVKWIPTVANPLILRAVDDIDRLCAEARHNAIWLEEHPGNVNLEVKPDERISLSRATKFLGLENNGFRRWLASRNGSHSLVGERGNAYILGCDLRAAIIKDRYDRPMLLRADGRVQTLGESLLVIFRNESANGRATNRFISVPIIWGMMRNFLCGSENMPSIFERHKYLNDEGKPYRVRTHDFRRLLNMIAQRGGLTQTEIAQWMGRRRVSDNASYDLRTPTEMAAEMRDLVEKNEVYGIIADQVRELPESERSAFLESRLAMSHTTAHGQCASNIAEAPCATAMSCLGGCRQYMRRKGDEKSRKSLLRIERDTLIALNNARKAKAAGKFNAENWILAQETTLRTTRAALAIDDDPTAATGDLRHVNPDGPLVGEPL